MSKFYDETKEFEAFNEKLAKTLLDYVSVTPYKDWPRLVKDAFFAASNGLDDAARRFKKNCPRS